MPFTQAEIDYQTAHKNENRANEMLVVHATCLTFAVIFVALRFISRRLKAGYGIDDWVMLAALVSSLTLRRTVENVQIASNC